MAHQIQVLESVQRALKISDPAIYSPTKKPWFRSCSPKTKSDILIADRAQLLSYKLVLHLLSSLMDLERLRVHPGFEYTETSAECVSALRDFVDNAFDEIHVVMKGESLWSCDEMAKQCVASLELKRLRAQEEEQIQELQNDTESFEDHSNSPDSGVGGCDHEDLEEEEWQMSAGH